MINYFAQRLARNKVTVLLFHKVPAAIDAMAPYESDLHAFEQVLAFICQRYRVIPLQDAMRGLQQGKLPSGSVCLTFDDGYADWIEGVVPALERRNAHATFFLTTGQFDGMPLWHERIRHAVHNAAGMLSGLSLQHPSLPVNSLAERQAAVAVLEQEYKYLPLAEREQRLLQLEAQTGSDPHLLPRMRPEQVRHVHNRGFAIGAHTVGHPILSLCSHAEARHELGAAREVLQSVIGAEVDCLAYPNGRQSDFSAEHVRLARDSGYRSAVTTEPGAMSAGTSLFHVPRFTPWGPDPLRMLLQMSRNLMRGSPGFSHGAD